MKKLLIQFHITPIELSDFINEVLRQNFQVFGLHRRTREVEVATEGEVDPAWIETHSQIAIVEPADELSKLDWNSLVELHHDALFVKVGNLENNTINQSWLSCQTSSESKFKRWKTLGNRLKAQTKSGMWVVNPKTLAVAFCQHFRFSRGALESFDEGCRLQAAAGHNLIFPREPLFMSQHDPTK
jgi:hypothetical protein